MFEFDVKEIFQERIYEVIFVLCSFHLGVVMVSYLLKWFHPYLKNQSNMNNYYEQLDSDGKMNLITLLRNKNAKKEHKTMVKYLYDNDSALSEEEHTNLIRHLETSIDVSSIPQEIFEKQFSKGNVLNQLSLEIDKAINIRQIIRDNLKKRKSISEAQTNITICPTFKTDCSSPKPIFSYQSKACDIPLDSSESSDSFESVCSNRSGSVESKLLPTDLMLDIHDIVTSKEITCKIHKTEAVKHNNSLDKNCSLASNRKMLKTHVESKRVEIHNDYDKQVSQENKILEIAINEFENELKPIKDQIKVLKECLHSFDCCETDNSFVSDLSSSVSDPITQSECCSEQMSSTYTSDLTSYPSKRKMLEQKFSRLKTENKFNQCKLFLDENTSLLSKPKSKNITLKRYQMFQPVGKYTSKGPNEIRLQGAGQPAHCTSGFNKRSPIADMYIKLSNCSSQTANFVKHSGPGYKQKSSDKSVTCHINLNFSLRAVTLSSTSMKNSIKDPEMQPLLSEPDDVLGEISHGHLKSKNVDNNTHIFNN